MIIAHINHIFKACFSFYLFLVLSFISNTCFAFKFTPEICARYKLGKNWHCESQKKDDEEDLLSAKDIVESKLSPIDKSTMLGELWDTQRKTAVITGKRADIAKFLETNNIITDKAVNFAKLAQKVVESTPQFGSSESYYKNIAEEEQRAGETYEILSNANRRFALIYVYSSSCTYCIRQYPIMMNLKDKYNIPIMGITMGDSETYEGFDENIIDDQITEDPLVVAFPTVLLIDKLVPSKFFIAKGITTLDSLEEKIANKIKEIEAEDE